MSRTSERIHVQVPREVWPPTGALAFVGSTIYATGFFLLAVAGREFHAPTYALVLAGAILVALPIYALGLVVTSTESVVGRAWASGFRLLDAPERRLRGTAARALRYAGFLWLANGCALWFATVVSHI